MSIEFLAFEKKLHTNSTDSSPTDQRSPARRIALGEITTEQDCNATEKLPCIPLCNFECIIKIAKVVLGNSANLIDYQ